MRDDERLVLVCVCRVFNSQRGSPQGVGIFSFCNRDDDSNRMCQDYHCKYKRPY